MLKRIDGYWMKVVMPSRGLFFLHFTIDPLPPGTNVYASISLSDINTDFFGNDADPKFSATAVIESWTSYLPDGTQSDSQSGQGDVQNAVWIENCATIKFVLFGERVAAIAQINILSL